MLHHTFYLNNILDTYWEDIYEFRTVYTFSHIHISKYLYHENRTIIQIHDDCRHISSTAFHLMGFHKNKSSINFSESHLAFVLYDLQTAVYWVEARMSCLHKSQGSEWDTVVLPISKVFSSMLYRNLLYTAISRAKQRVVIVGDPDALTTAIRREAPPRRSMLVAKTHSAQEHAA